MLIFFSFVLLNIDVNNVSFRERQLQSTLLNVTPTHFKIFCFTQNVEMMLPRNCASADRISHPIITIALSNQFMLIGKNKLFFISNNNPKVTPIYFCSFLTFANFKRNIYHTVFCDDFISGLFYFVIVPR